MDNRGPISLRPGAIITATSPIRSAAQPPSLRHLPGFWRPPGPLPRAGPRMGCGSGFCVLCCRNKTAREPGQGLQLVGAGGADVWGDGRGASRRARAPPPGLNPGSVRRGRRSQPGVVGRTVRTNLDTRRSPADAMSLLCSATLAGCLILQAGAVQGRDDAVGPHLAPLPAFSGARKAPGHCEPSLPPRAADTRKRYTGACEAGEPP